MEQAGVHEAAAAVAEACHPWQSSWTVVVELAVHVMGRAFGFQLVNAAQEGSQAGRCTPASCGVAGDHLRQLLRDRAAVIAAEPGAGSGNEAHAVLHAAVESLHAAYFDQGPYQAWQAKSQVLTTLDAQLQTFAHSPSMCAASGPQQGANGRLNGFVGVAAGPRWVQQLAELALYFLLWTEAANLRHTPELLWMLLHIMLSSKNYNKACSLLGSADGCHYSLLHWLEGGSAKRQPSRAPSGAVPLPPGAAAATDTGANGAAAADDTADTASSERDSGPAGSLDVHAKAAVEGAGAAAGDQAGGPDPGHEAALAAGFVRGVLLPARDALGNAMRLGALLEWGPGPWRRRAKPGLDARCPYGFAQNTLAERQLAGLDLLKQQGAALDGTLPGAWSLQELVAEDVRYFGDGCIFLDMVVQPVFNLMAEQIGLMGEKGEQPALRLGYDDFNESACIAAVLRDLSRQLGAGTPVDAWDGLLRHFNVAWGAVEKQLQQSGFTEVAFRPVTPKGMARYPRNYKRLLKLGGVLRDCGAGGAEGAAVLRAQQCSGGGAAADAGGPDQRPQPDGQAAAAAPQQAEELPLGGTVPVVHLLPSLGVTDTLWAELFKKSFVETRSVGAVMVAFSRVYILHAVLLCVWTLWAYLVPELSLTGPHSIFTASFWSRPSGVMDGLSNGLALALCVSWGLLLHAVLHVIKAVIIHHLLAAPHAIRFEDKPGDQPRVAAAGERAQLSRLQRWWAKQWAPQHDGFPLRIAPPVHGGREVRYHNLVTLLFWCACAYVLLDSHLPKWPINRLLTRMLMPRGAAEPALPVWAFTACIYVGLWLLHRVWQVLADRLPPRLGGGLMRLTRKDNRRAVEAFYPYGAMSASQDWSRFVASCCLWGCVLLVKLLFDFFFVLQPLMRGGPAPGPARVLLASLVPPPGAPPRPWFEWAQKLLAVFAMWVAAAFLVFGDTGLFFQIIGGLYSTLFLGMRRRLGHVKTWYDLVWAFPRLNKKLIRSMIPAGPGQVPQLMPPRVPAPAGAGKDMDAAATGAFTIVCRTGSSVGGGAAAGDSGALLPLAPLPLSSDSEVVFCQAWDQIVVHDLRSRDLLTNKEAASLKYELLAWAPGRQRAWLLLPRFVAAGAAVEVVHHGITSMTQIEVVCRSFNLLLWLLHVLKLLEAAEVSKLLLIPSADAAEHLTSSSAAQHTGGSGGGKDVASAPGAAALQPRVARNRDIEAAAELLHSSRELLSKVQAKLNQAAEPFHLQDVDSRLLMEQLLKGVQHVAALAPAGCAAHDVASNPQLPERPFAEEPLSAEADPFGEAADLARAAAAEPAELRKLGARWQKRRALSKQVVAWLLDMLTLTRGDAAPASPEAVRALCFFATSLSNPKLPAAAPVGLTRSMTTLTPHYGEDVIYGLSSEAVRQEMGLAGLKRGDTAAYLLDDDEEPTETLKYLRVVYEREWANFAERLFGMTGVADALRALRGGKAPRPADISEALFAPGGALEPWRSELLSWASMRGQLLQRTVHGMMYYEAALQQLVLMQSRGELTQAARAAAGQFAGPQGLRGAHGAWVDAVVERAALLLAREKYTYVVSSQILGELVQHPDASQRWLAHCIRRVLAQRYPSLRIAYIDWENLGARPQGPAQSQDGQHAGSSGAQRLVVGPRERGKGSGVTLLRQYSVLLQWDEAAGCVLEQYRVRLPINLETQRGVILGEGKPENQNHAVIFCHGETVQTIDCNQDGFLVEALKLPNLLAEFDLDSGGARASGRGGSADAPPHTSRGRPRACCAGGGVGGRSARKSQGPALVGFREWVFSEDSGALAKFAATTERSFGTTMQRLMHNPGACRFHYGHPDIWDKLFTMTNGGVSKSTKGLHVSEDVFGGYNVMLRGRDIRYVDYIAVGKGRDMGFETINTFEAKIAGGNGEQVISRDVHRLARRLNMPRLLTWYHTGNGFFINTSLLMYSLLVNAWLCLLLALLANSSGGLGRKLLQDSLALLGGLQLLQLGSLSLLVYVATVWLEEGFLVTLKNVLKQLVSGSLLFYVFRGQTSAAAFNSDIRFGGAAYAATGRGYKLKATPFIQLFQKYSRSHMWFGAHLLMLVIVACAVGLPVSFLGLWSYVVVILALLMAPFWFNPFAFDWSANMAAASEFVAWMAGHTAAGKPKVLWRQWNEAQLKQVADDDGLQLGRTTGALAGMIYLLPSVIIICVAIFASTLDAWWKSIIAVVVANVLLGACVAVWSLATHLEAVRHAASTSRFVKFVVKLFIITELAGLIGCMAAPQYNWLAPMMVRIVFVELELARLVGRLLLAFLPHYQPARRLINAMAWLADLGLGLLLLLLLFVGSLFGLLTRYQAAVLFSMGYAAAYLSEEGLKHSEVGRLAKELQELQRQERAVASAKPKPSAGGGAGSGSSNSGGGGGDGPDDGSGAGPKPGGSGSGAGAPSPGPRPAAPPAAGATQPAASAGGSSSGGAGGAAALRSPSSPPESLRGRATAADTGSTLARRSPSPISSCSVTRGSVAAGSRASASAGGASSAAAATAAAAGAAPEQPGAAERPPRESCPADLSRAAAEGAAAGERWLAYLRSKSRYSGLRKHLGEQGPGDDVGSDWDSDFGDELPAPAAAAGGSASGAAAARPEGGAAAVGSPPPGPAAGGSGQGQPAGPGA